MRVSARAATASVLVGLLGVAVVAQEAKLKFEVASVRPNETGRLSGSLVPRFQPGGRFTPSVATVESLLTFAHQLRAYQIVGGPAWVRKKFFEINAKAGYEASINDMREMVRSLLEDRFSLVTHIEQRTIRGLALVLARPAAPLTPNLIKIDECSAGVLSELRRKFPEKYPVPTGGLMSSCSSMGLGNLADVLTLIENTPVIDATGLKESFFYTMVSRSTLSTAFLGTTHPNPDLPSLSTALEEQLGLKLESRRITLDVLVIDSVQELSPN
jgi:uncharacterized protein (TIGR03435 family)